MIGASVLSPLPVHRLSQHLAPDADPQGFPDGGPEVWGERSCGLACVRMLLRYHRLPVPGQASMLNRGLDLGAYSDQGWVHAGLVRLAEVYGLTGTAVRVGGIAELETMAAHGVAPIVSSTFRFPQDGRRGGHLVVFTGTSVLAGQPMARFADPSRWGADHDAVSPEHFWASCTGNVIALWPPGDAPASLTRTHEVSYEG